MTYNNDTNTNNHNNNNNNNNNNDDNDDNHNNDNNNNDKHNNDNTSALGGAGVRAVIDWRNRKLEPLATRTTRFSFQDGPSILFPTFPLCRPAVKLH